MSKSTPASDYQGLTPDVILNAIENIGIYPETGLLALNSYENRVYQFRCDQANRYVVKFYRPDRWTNEQIIEEHAFTHTLADQEVPVAVPLIINDQSLHFFQGYRFAIFPSLGGRQFEVDNLDHLAQVGRFIGRIHQHGAAENFSHRQQICPTNRGRSAIDFLQSSGHVPKELKQDFFDAANNLMTRIEFIWQQQKFHNIRLHGDLHPGNILWMPDGPGFVDLDDACSGPAIQDLWMMLSGDRQTQIIQLDTLLEGYQDFYDLDHAQLALIEPLRAMRMLHHCGWISRRWDDPAFPRYFPWFAENNYWLQQTNAYQEQLLMLEEPPLSLLPY